MVLLAAACQSAGTPSRTALPFDQIPPLVDVPPAPAGLSVPGTFIFGRDGNLWSLKHRGSPQKLTALPSTSFPAYPTVSPDGQQIAFSLYLPSQTASDLGGTDLYLMKSDGSDLRMILQHDLPGSLFESPAWSPDGRSLLYTYRAQIYENSRFTGEVLRLERTALDRVGRTPVLDNGSQVSYFPDGRRIVYLMTDLTSYAQSLWVANPDGSLPQRLVEAGRFGAMFQPKPSPDGSAIVFGAAGDTQSAVPGPGGTGGVVVPWMPKWLRSALAPPRVAEAHGIPWDLWMIQSDGTRLRRVTEILEDSPYAVWLPSGDAIAFMGERALYHVDKDGRQVVRLADELGGIGLTWLP